MNHRKRAATRVVLIVVALLTTMTGCQPSRTVKPPKTFPVSGKVTIASGKDPAGLLLNFIALDDPEKTATAMVEKDASFQLHTKYMGVECEGAAAGNYRVRLERLDGEPVSQLTEPINVSEPMSDLSLKFHT